MAESLIGRQVRLTGEGWRDEWVHLSIGSIQTIVANAGGAEGPVIASGAMRLLVILDPTSYMYRMWSGELLPERPELGQQGKGYLDGWLGLPIESSDDAYLLGYVHGEEARERSGE